MTSFNIIFICTLTLALTLTLSFVSLELQISIFCFLFKFAVFEKEREREKETLCYLVRNMQIIKAIAIANSKDAFAIAGRHQPNKQSCPIKFQGKPPQSQTLTHCDTSIWHLALPNVLPPNTCSWSFDPWRRIWHFRYKVDEGALLFVLMPLKCICIILELFCEF